MKSKLRFRHVFGEPVREKFECIKPTTATCESNLIKGNSLYCGVSLFSGGGGSLAVLKYGTERKLEPEMPTIKGHSGAIIDFDFYPFDESIIATASDDATIKLWQIPTDWKENLTSPLVSLDAHSKKVHLITWNPTSEFVLASCSHDNTVKVWNAQKPDQCLTVGGPTEPALSLEWNSNGSLLGTVWKDKVLRIIDPRAGSFVQEAKSHEGPKSQKFCWIGDDHCLTVGFSKDFHRQYFLWNLKNMEKPMTVTDIDQASGALYPFYDNDLNMLYLAGKGDGNIRYYEFVDEEFHYCMDYRTNVSARGYGFLPKRAVDVSKCELMKCLKLTDNAVEAISFIAPRKADSFQEDLFPDCNSEIAAQTAAAWFEGSTVNPKKRSMAPGGGQGKSPVGVKSFNIGGEDVSALKQRVTLLEQELESKNALIEKLQKELEEAKH